MKHKLEKKQNYNNKKKKKEIKSIAVLKKKLKYLKIKPVFLIEVYKSCVTFL
jgi:hypothetical protein